MRGQRFKQQVARKAALPIEAHNWWWNPSRVNALPAPESFQKKLRDVDPENFIDVRWNAYNQIWGVFYKKPSIQSKICSGWVLLFTVKPQELDERVLARLYEASAAKWGNGKQYFAAIEREYEREQELKDKRRTEEAIDMAMPYWEHSKISTAGKGNKFSEYHS